MEGRLAALGTVSGEDVATLCGFRHGAGDIRTYKEWPTPDERVQLADLVTEARAIAHATYCLCR